MPNGNGAPVPAEMGHNGHSHAAGANGYGYASGQPSIAHFGLGDATEVDLVIRTPDGKRRTISKVAADQRYVVRGE